MKRNSRLSSTLHILVHMAEKPEHALTSEQLATFIHTNPVVVRRTIAGLRDAGIVTSSRGHGGGWLLGARMTQADITVAAATTFLHEALALAPARYPALMRQVARCEALPAFREIHLPFFAPQPSTRPA